LKHANEVCNWITNWIPGDTHKPNKGFVSMVKGFTEFTDNNMKDIKGILDNVKEKSLLMGNNNFRSKSNDGLNRSEKYKSL